MSTQRCTCDDFGEGPCPVHAEEMRLQDERIAAHNSEPHKVSEPMNELEFYRKYQQLEAENAKLKKRVECLKEACEEARWSLQNRLGRVDALVAVSMALKEEP